MANVQLNSFFNDISEKAKTKKEISTDDKVYAYVGVPDNPSFSDLVLLTVYDIIDTEDFDDNGLLIIGIVSYFDESNILIEEKIPARVVYPLISEGSVLTKDGQKYIGTFIDKDGTSKQKLFLENEICDKYKLELIISVPQTILTISLNMTGDFLFKNKKQVTNFINKCNIGNCVLVNDGIILEFCNSSFTFKDFKVLDNKNEDTGLNLQSLFEYMCYNCKPTYVSENNMNYEKQFKLKIKKITPSKFLKQK